MKEVLDYDVEIK